MKKISFPSKISIEKIALWFPFISGVLMAVSFTFENLWFFNFFALIPLFLSLDFRRTKFRMFRGIFAYSLSFYIPLMFWLYELLPAMDFGSWSFPLMSLGIILIAVLQGLYLSSAVCVFATVRKKNILDVFAFSALYVLGEWFQEITPFYPFPWGRLGVSAAQFPAFIQSASLFGSLFISFLILVINGLLAYGLTHIKEIKQVGLATGLLAVIFAVNTMYGSFRISSGENITPDKNVTLVQGNFSGQEKWNSGADVMLERYIGLTCANVTEETDLVIWPETAVPICLQDYDIGKRQLLELAESENITLVIGVNHHTFTNNDKQKFNSMVAITPSGTISEPYSKQILVPFGEFLPFEGLVELFCGKEGNFSSYNAGNTSDPLETPIGNIGGIICYESIFPKIARRSSASGAEAFAVISNDSWFGDSPALYQHHSQAVLRAVENKRYVLRASNTAVTSIISPYGVVEKTAFPFKEGALTGKFYTVCEKTLYTKVGDFWILGCIAVFFYGIMKSRKQKQDSDNISR